MSENGESTARPIRILVVDDLAAVREELTAVLKLKAGLDVVGAAGDGLAAIQLAEQLRPDIVLMDVELPGLDGFDTAQQLMANRFAQAIIMLSIHSRHENRQRARAVGVAAYVEKGEGVDALIAAIHRVWGERSLSPGVNRESEV